MSASSPVEASTSMEATTGSTGMEAASSKAGVPVAVVVAAVIVTASVAVAAAIWIDESAATDVVRRVEAVAKRAPEQAITRQPCVAVRSASPIPARIEDWIACVLFRNVDVRFAQVLRSQAAPVIEIVLGFVLVEALCLSRFSG